MRFNPEEYHSQRADGSIGWPLHLFDELESTNTWCRQAPASEVPHGAVCLAEHQTAGRGQFQRRWLSQANLNLTYSIVLTPGRSTGLALLKQVAALATADTLFEAGLADVRIKWPNDILVANRKIAGILVDCVFKGSALSRVVVGVGLNVFQTRFPEDITYLATSVTLCRPDALITREHLLARYMVHFERRYGQWERHDMALRGDLFTHVAGMGLWCHIRINNIPQNDPVKIVGVDDDGHLVVVNSQLRPVTFTHEDVRIDRPSESL